MLKKYISKFAMDMFPSVLATIIGAYIVNHYIAKPSDPPAASTVSPAPEKKAEATAASSSAAKSPNSKPAGAGSAEPKAAESSAASTNNIPEPGVKAKGISEKAIAEKSAAENSPVEKSSATVADKPPETASNLVESRRRPLQARERMSGKSAPPAAVQGPAAPPANPNTAATLDTAPVQEESHDVANLARAALSRLRSVQGSSPRPQEVSRAPLETPPNSDQSSRAVAAPPVAPLPPPVVVVTPVGENLGTPVVASSPTGPPDTHVLGVDAFARPTPPADIPVAVPSASQPVELGAEATEQRPRERTTVAEDVLSAAKSVFNAVLPKNQN
jgi:hypothetical protein